VLANSVLASLNGIYTHLFLQVAITVNALTIVDSSYKLPYSSCVLFNMMDKTNARTLTKGGPRTFGD